MSAIGLSGGAVRQTIPIRPRLPNESMAMVVKLAKACHAETTKQIAKLAALRDQGALTEAEFATKKTELLDRI